MEGYIKLETFKGGQGCISNRRYFWGYIKQESFLGVHQTRGTFSGVYQTRETFAGYIKQQALLGNISNKSLLGYIKQDFKVLCSKAKFCHDPLSIFRQL